MRRLLDDENLRELAAPSQTAQAHFFCDYFYRAALDLHARGWA